MKKRTMTATAGAALLLLAIAGEAKAGEGAWRVGRDLVVRSETLDLGVAEDREQLLRLLEWAGARQCVRVGVRKRRRACEAETVSMAVTTAPAGVRQALRLAMSARGRTALAAR
jgi:hypothetical protein